MALQRPNAIVFQEYESITVAPDIPDLNVLVVGPCYQIEDYVDDKTDIYAADYGTKNISMATYGTPASVVISAPPGVAAGALLEENSVAIYFDELRAVLKRNTSAPTDDAQFWANDNLFKAATHFGGAYIEAGDVLIAESGASDYIKVIKELAYTLEDGDDLLDFVAEGVVPGDSVEIFDDQTTGTVRNGFYTVKKIYAEGNPLAVVTDILEIEDAANLLGDTADVHMRVKSSAGATKFDTSSAGGPTGGARFSLIDACHLRTTSDFAANNDGVAKEWRIERTMYDTQVDSTYITVDENSVTIDLAAVGVQVGVSTAIGNKPVSYAKIYEEYMALRQDLQNLTEIDSTSGLISTLGKIDARNPLAVGASVAAQNTTTPVQVYGVKSDDVTGYADFIERTESDKSVYAIVPLTYNQSIIGSLKVMAENLADPTYALDNGTRQKFRVILGAVELVTSEYVTNETSGASTLVVPSTSPAGRYTLDVAVTTTGTASDFTTLPLVPGDTLTITPVSGGPFGPYTISHVISATKFEVDVDVALEDWDLGGGGVLSLIAAGDQFEIKSAAGVNKATHAVGTDNVTVIDLETFTLVTATLSTELYLTLYSPTSLFIDNGVVPGDVLQIPLDPESNTSWTNYQSWVVASVDSQERITIVNSGKNTSTTSKELPHFVKRDGTPVDRLVTGAAVYFRVQRDMTKTQQVTSMLQVAQSHASKRVVLTYPSLIDVADLVDGSKDRGTSTDPALADSQPGYYLSCAVGGQTAGNPSHQGFTNLSIAGINRVYNSNGYFSEPQLTDLSNGGVYVFKQETPAALPYTIHEVTTDVSSLETGEYMVVKNFDFIAATYLGTIIRFIGVWNVNDDTVGFIDKALHSTTENLKSRYKSKIGSPLISATVDNVEQATDLSKDRIEAYMSVELPMTLNIIGLHLVA